jgi:hypothetical protein
VDSRDLYTSISIKNFEQHHKYLCFEKQIKISIKIVIGIGPISYRFVKSSSTTLQRRDLRKMMFTRL